MNRAIKALLNHNRKSLKELNKAFGFDYNKPYQAKLIKGNTTIKKILKEIEADPNTLIVVLTCNPEHWSKEYRAAVIDTQEHIEIANGYQHFKLYSGSGLSTYHTKGDFRESIKTYNATTIVIAQDKKLLNPIDDRSSFYHHIEINERYKIPNDDRAINHYTYKCDPYIDRVILIETTNSGKRIEYHTVQGQYKTDDINQVIDKSGYIVELNREELRRKAKALKAEREKSAYLASDNTKQIEELRIRITAKKLELIEMLKAADTSEALKEVSKCLESWSNGYASIVESFEKMQKGIENKSYSSIEDFNRHYTGISNMLLNNGKR